jgi:energy-coupling factor transport system ATP-binding protein
MLLEARGLAVAHPGSPSGAGFAAGPLDFDLAPGECVAVVGGNGSGKSALLLVLAGLVAPRAGTVRIDGRAPGRRGTGSPDVGIVFQEPETQFVTDRVVRELAFGLENLGWPRREIEARVAELVAAFDLAALAEAPPTRLSGGEMQRVALAAAIAPRPRILLLDEPAAYLDRAAGAAFVEHVRRLQRDDGVAIVWAACARDECPLADRTVDLPGRSASVRSAPVAAPILAPPPVAASPEPPLWRARGIRLERRDERGTVVLWGGASFEIRPGETWVVVGPNGSGKTSLLDALAGWLRPTSGALESPEWFKGSPTLGYVGQFPESQLFAATTLEDVGFGVRSRRGPEALYWKAQAARALEAAGLDPERDGERAPETLSLGERRRAAIAGVLAGQPTVLLLDEPTVGLDPGARSELLATLQRRQSGGGTLILATHDPAWLDLERARTLVLGCPEGPTGDPALRFESP